MSFSSNISRNEIVFLFFLYNRIINQELSMLYYVFDEWFFETNIIFPNVDQMVHEFTSFKFGVKNKKSQKHAEPDKTIKSLDVLILGRSENYQSFCFIKASPMVFISGKFGFLKKL